MKYKDKQEFRKFIMNVIDDKINKHKENEEYEKRKEQADNDQKIIDDENRKIELFSCKINKYIFSEIKKMEDEKIEINENNFFKYFCYDLLLQVETMNNFLSAICRNTRL